MRIRMSSVGKAITSSGMSAQVSSAGASGVVSISCGGAEFEADGVGSAPFSGWLAGGGLGGTDDIVVVLDYERKSRTATRVPFSPLLQQNKKGNIYY